jgi:aspartate/methionine/tyrosine aminotransferase
MHDQTRKTPEEIFHYAHTHDVAWMSQNTNHLPTYKAVRQAIKNSIQEQEYSKYPIASGLPGLPEAIAQDIGMPDYGVLVTAGGIEGIYILARALLKPGDEVITSDPSFFMIHKVMGLAGAKCTNLPVYEAPCKYRIEQVKNAITPNTKMLLLIDPLNPTGAGYTQDEVRAYAELARDHNLLILDDVTYRDFADNHFETTQWAPERTFIAYSFSKSCGMAGMRIGALAGPKELMDQVIPYNTNDLSVNVVAQRGALAALQTKKDWFPKNFKICRDNQKRIKRAVAKVEGARLPIYPSQANMFCIDISQTGVDPDMVEERMLYDHNVFVRSGNYVSKQFGSRFVRVSFSVPPGMARRFARAFPVVMEQLRKKEPAPPAAEPTQAAGQAPPGPA